jgi:hypothetical protein
VVQQVLELQALFKVIMVAAQTMVIAVERVAVAVVLVLLVKLAHLVALMEGMVVVVSLHLFLAHL